MSAPNPTPESIAPPPATTTTTTATNTTATTTIIIITVSAQVQYLLLNAKNVPQRAEFWHHYLAEALPPGLVPHTLIPPAPQKHVRLEIHTVFSRVFMSGIVKRPSDMQGERNAMREAYNRASLETGLCKPYLVFLADTGITFFEGQLEGGMATETLIPVLRIDDPVAQVEQVATYLKEKYEELPLNQRI